MPTAQSLMDKALRALGVLRVGGSAAGAQQAECLGVLNAMIDRWQTERLTIYQIAAITHSLTPGDGDYTVYTGGDINIARPVKIEPTSFLRWLGEDYPLTLLTRQGYADLSPKSMQGFPESLYYDDQFPQAVLYVWPVPLLSYELHLDYWSPLSSFAAAATNIALPPGYEAALWWGLAAELWSFYPNPGVQAMVVRNAATSKASIQTNNVRVPALSRTFGMARGYSVMADR